MADGTHIQWTDATWNIVTGCTLVDEGCRNCYAAGLAATRLKNHPSREGLARLNAAGEAKFTGEVRFNEPWLTQPLLWTKPRLIFVCAHGDLFHENVPDEWIDKVFAVMALTPHHTFQVLTKRPGRAREYLTAFHSRGFAGPIAELYVDHPEIAKQTPLTRILAIASSIRPLPNVWLGTSASDQASADARIPDLLAAPAAVRFLSAEPLLGQMDLRKLLVDEGDVAFRVDALAREHPWHDLYGGGRLDWVIVGGESGKKARPMHPQWARDIRDQCVAAGVPFFFKQQGEWSWGDFAPGEPGSLGPDRCGWVLPDGRWGLAGDSDAPDILREKGWVHILRVGKASAGRLLDGREWNEMPGVKHG